MNNTNSLSSPGSERPFVTYPQAFADFLTELESRNRTELFYCSIAFNHDGFHLHIVDSIRGKADYYGNLAGEAVVGLIASSFFNSTTNGI